MKSEPFHNSYRDLLSRLCDGRTSHNERTGAVIRTLPEVFDAFSIDLNEGKLPLPGNRRMHPRTAAAEVAWFLSGDRDVTWLRKYAPIWDKFVEADGVTVEAAYGYRWRRHFGRDQIAAALTALEADASNRQIVVSAWDPTQDGLGNTGKNIPCPTHFTLRLDHAAPDDYKKRLSISVFKRSTDVFVGLPYDVMGYALLLNAFALELGAEPGHLMFALAHPHLYGKHREMALESLKQPIIAALPDMPYVGIKEIVDTPDEYVDCMVQHYALVQKHTYNPKPEVVQ